MDDIAVHVEGLGKKYRLGAVPASGTAYDAIATALRAPFRRRIWDQSPRQSNTIWALKDITFDLRRGEVLGIIGRNGAGKSTLLKILSRITEPTEGTVDLYGRVSSLLEVGTGFHPELTGRENIFLNGAILGMRRAEITRKFDEIVAFAEVERFLDTPVKHYSSGMYLRLAFAVAAHLEPEILLVDEVLAVGDAAFQEKCLGRMGEIQQGGRAVLFVSHNMSAVTALCTRAILLEEGCIQVMGMPQEVVSGYLSRLHRLSSIPLGDRGDRQGDGRLRFAALAIGAGSKGTPASGHDLTLGIEYIGQDGPGFSNVVMNIAFYGIHGQFLFMCGNEMAGRRFEHLPPKGHITCRVPRLPLSPGIYLLNLYCTVNGILADWVQQAARLTVSEGDFFGTGRLPPASHGGLLVPHEWSLAE
jgi:lipopolysaccharide transport system ATP-binding protein